MPHHTTFLALVAAGGPLSPAPAPAGEGGGPPAAGKGAMTSMTIPASDRVFEAASEPPKTDDTWAVLRKAVETLAASGRLLTRAELARDKTTWMEMARALVTEADKALKVVQAKNGDALAQAGDDLYMTCENCHARYLESTAPADPPR